MALVLRAKSAGSQKRDVGVGGSGSSGKHSARRALEKKGFSAADSHTATIFAEACAAMKYNDKGGNAATFNPFRENLLASESDIR